MRKVNPQVPGVQINLGRALGIGAMPKSKPKKAVTPKKPATPKVVDPPKEVPVKVSLSGRWMEDHLDIWWGDQYPPRPEGDYSRSGRMWTGSITKAQADELESRCCVYTEMDGEDKKDNAWIIGPAWNVRIALRKAGFFGGTF